MRLLVDSWNRPVRMPSDFDDFTPAAMWRYMGSSLEIRAHVRLLQYAMHSAGFWGLRTEWWHFTIAGLAKILAAEEAQHSAQVCGTQWKANYDRGLHTPRFAAAGIRSCVAQSVAGLRPAYRLDRLGHRCDFKEPPRSDRHISAGIHHLNLRMAGLRIWPARIRSRSVDD